MVRGKTGVYYSLIQIGEEKGAALGARHFHVATSPSCTTLEFSSLSCETGKEVRGSHFRGLYSIDLGKVYITSTMFTDYSSDTRLYLISNCKGCWEIQSSCVPIGRQFGKKLANLYHSDLGSFSSSVT